MKLKRYAIRWRIGSVPGSTVTLRAVKEFEAVTPGGDVRHVQPGDTLYVDKDGLRIALKNGLAKWADDELRTTPAMPIPRVRRMA